MRLEMTLPRAVVLVLASCGCVTNERLFTELPQAAELDVTPDPLAPTPAATTDPTALGEEVPFDDVQLGSPAGTEGQGALGQPASPRAVVEGARARSLGCETGSIEPGDATFELSHAGQLRRYHVHVPSGYDRRSPVPVVVDLHGMTSTALEHADLSGWREKADAVGFIVVYPEGLDGSWNGGSLCCGSSMDRGVDDEGFIRALIARLRAAMCIDDTRIYATGISSGGAMAHLLACRAADLFAATAPVSMGNGTTPCEPARPISVVMARGVLDLVARFDGSSEYPGAEEDFAHWRDLNGCSGEPQPVDDECDRYENCTGGVEVMACRVLGQHVLYENIVDFSVPDAAWSVFERQPIR
jgi:polyhydroxybutyrate depolymerase